MSRIAGAVVAVALLFAAAYPAAAAVEDLTHRHRSTRDLDGVTAASSCSTADVDHASSGASCRGATAVADDDDHVTTAAGTSCSAVHVDGTAAASSSCPTLSAPTATPATPPAAAAAGRLRGRIVYALGASTRGLPGVEVSVLRGGALVGRGVTAADGTYIVVVPPRLVPACDGSAGAPTSWVVVPGGGGAGVVLDPPTATLDACGGGGAAVDPTFTVTALAVSGRVGMPSLSRPPPPPMPFSWSAQEAEEAAAVLAADAPAPAALTPLAGVGVTVDGVSVGVSNAGGGYSASLPWQGSPLTVTLAAESGPDFTFPPGGQTVTLTPVARALPPLLAASQRVCGRVGLGEHLLGVLPIKWRFVRLFRRPADEGAVDAALPLAAGAAARPPPRDVYYPTSVSALAVPLWSVEHLAPAGDDDAVDGATPITTFTSGGNLSPLQPVVANTVHARATATLVASLAAQLHEAVLHATGVDVSATAGRAWAALAAPFGALTMPDNLTQWLTQLLHGEVGHSAPSSALPAVSAAHPDGRPVPPRRTAAGRTHPQRALLPRSGAASPPRRLGKMVGYVFTDADGTFCFPAVTPGRYHVVPALTIAEVDQLGVGIHPLAYAVEVGTRVPAPMPAPTVPSGHCTSGAPGCRLRDLHFTVDWPTVAGAVAVAPGGGGGAADGPLTLTLEPLETQAGVPPQYPYAALPLHTLHLALPPLPPAGARALPVSHVGRTTHAWVFARVHEQLVQGGQGVSGSQYFFHELNDTGCGVVAAASRFQRTLVKPRDPSTVSWCPPEEAASPPPAQGASDEAAAPPPGGGVTGLAVACTLLPGSADGMLAVNTTFGALEYAACHRRATQLEVCGAPPPPPGRCHDDVPAGGEPAVRAFAFHGVQPGVYRLTLTPAAGAPAWRHAPLPSTYTIEVAPAADATDANFRLLPPVSA